MERWKGRRIGVYFQIPSTPKVPCPFPPYLTTPPLAGETCFWGGISINAPNPSSKGLLGEAREDPRPTPYREQGQEKGRKKGNKKGRGKGREGVWEKKEGKKVLGLPIKMYEYLDKKSLEMQISRVHATWEPVKADRWAWTSPGSSAKRPALLLTEI